MNIEDILIPLIKNEIPVSQALSLSKLLLRGSTSLAELEWINQEIEGYTDKLRIPDYRQFPCLLFTRNAVAYIGIDIKPLDAHDLDKDMLKKGYPSLYEMRIPDGIERIENIIASQKGDKIMMSFPQEMTNMFIDAINIPGGRVLDIYQEAESSYLHGIITAVKNRLINILMHYSSNEKLSKESNSSRDTNHYKSVFISYSWDNHEHEEWVRYFVNTIKNHGVKTYFDKDLPYGADIPAFMQKGITEADVVLVIGTHNYFAKIQSAKATGVRFEDSVITDALASDVDSTKFIPILRQGSFDTSFSKLLEHRKGIDFSDDIKFDENINELLMNCLLIK